ncbi:MAG: peptidylprolyl isomerase, partial [Oscillatoriales cyanobacterium]
EERGLKASEVEVMATRSQRIQKFKEAKWGRKVRRYFMERKPGLDAVIYSLIRTQDAGLAHELYYRILEGEITFEQCAATYSQGPEARTGGKMGPVPLNRPHPVISKLLSVSQPGQLWPPRLISDWHIIIRLEDIKSAQLDDATRQALIDELYGAWLQDRVKTLMAQVLSPEQQAESAAIAAAPAQPASEPEEDLPDLDHDSQATTSDTPESVPAVLDNSTQDGLESDLVVMDAPEVDDADAGIVLEDLDDLDDLTNAHTHDSTPNASQSLVSTSA